MEKITGKNAGLPHNADYVAGVTDMENSIVKPGFRSGLLEVIETAPRQNGRKMWLCRCDCGSQKIVSDSHLKSGHTKSCGCISRRRPIAPGMRVGQLVLIAEAPRREGCRFWLCRCDCGRECQVSETHLKTGHTKSCGCFQRKTAQEKAFDLFGRRFDRLEVVGKEPERFDGVAKWRCRCDCGQECYAEAEYLLRGKTKSCGCLQEEQRKLNMEKAIHFVDGTCIEKIACQREIATNTSGHRGVLQRKNGMWRAYLTFRGKRHDLGTYPSFEEAVKARLEGESTYYEEYLKQYRQKQEAV